MIPPVAMHLSRCSTTDMKSAGNEVASLTKRVPEISRSAAYIIGMHIGVAQFLWVG